MNVRLILIYQLLVSAGHQWLLGAALDRDVADTDQYLYTRFQQKWQLLGQHQLST